MAEEMTNLTVRLPKRLLEKLAGAAGARGMSARVREMLEAGLRGEAPIVGDAETAELLRFVADAARGIRDSYNGREWHQDRAITEAFLLAIAEEARLIADASYGDASLGDPDPVGQPGPPEPGTPLDRNLRRLRATGELTIERLANAIQFLRPEPDGAAQFAEHIARLKDKP